jgi:hypothetical protein
LGTALCWLERALDRAFAEQPHVYAHTLYPFFVWESCTWRACRAQPTVLESFAVFASIPLVWKSTGANSGRPGLLCEVVLACALFVPLAIFTALSSHTGG